MKTWSFQANEKRGSTRTICFELPRRVKAFLWRGDGFAGVAFFGTVDEGKGSEGRCRFRASA